jgi:hypothetical protein
MDGLEGGMKLRADSIIRQAISFGNQTEFHQRILKCVEELKVEPNKDNKISRMSILNLFVRDLSLRIKDLEFGDLCLIYQEF